MVLEVISYFNNIVCYRYILIILRIRFWFVRRFLGPGSICCDRAASKDYGRTNFLRLQIENTLLDRRPVLGVCYARMGVIIKWEMFLI